MEAKIGVAHAEISKGNAAADWEKMGAGAKRGASCWTRSMPNGIKKSKSPGTNSLDSFTPTTIKLSPVREQLLFTGLGVGELHPSSGEVTATNEN